MQDYFFNQTEVVDKHIFIISPQHFVPVLLFLSNIAVKSFILQTYEPWPTAGLPTDNDNHNFLLPIKHCTFKYFSGSPWHPGGQRSMMDWKNKFKDRFPLQSTIVFHQASQQNDNPTTHFVIISSIVPHQLFTSNNLPWCPETNVIITWWRSFFYPYCLWNMIKLCIFDFLENKTNRNISKTVTTFLCILAP